MAELLRSRREQLGLSQRELAEKAAVAQTTVHNLEHGSSRVQLDTFLQILAALDLIPQQVLSIEGVLEPMLPTEAEAEILALIRNGDIPALMIHLGHVLKAAK